MSEGTNESRSNGGLDAAWKASAVEATVPPTAGELIAEWLLETEAKLASLSRCKADWCVPIREVLESQKRRLKSILDAIHAST